MITRYHHRDHVDHANTPGLYHDIRLASVDYFVRVKNPKTPDAEIDYVQFINGSFKYSDRIQFPKVAEPVLTGNGRLLVARLHDATLTLPNGEGTASNINMVYATYPDTYANGNLQQQCDVRKLINFRPLSYAHYDSEMNGRFNFAKFPLRDSLNRPIPKGKPIGGSYPWMDKSASNLFYTGFGSDDSYYGTDGAGGVLSLFVENVAGLAFDGSAYQVPEAPNERQNFEVVNADTAGLMVQGFWTYGKMVVIDGQLNSADYNFRISNPDHDVLRQLKIYNDETTPYGQEFETIGSIRERGNTVDESVYGKVLSRNSSFIGSIENRLNYVEGLKTITPRDIVWHFSNMRITDEIAFDDFINPYVLINAEMTAAAASMVNRGTIRNFDGVVNGAHVGADNLITGFPIHPMNEGSGHAALIQNAASAPSAFMSVPLYGKVTQQDVRVEPIAKGGIHGKGLWLDRNQGIEFQVPEQTGASFDIEANDKWYVGVFIDPREYNNPSAGYNSHFSKFINIIKEDGVDGTVVPDLRIKLKKHQTSQTVAYDRLILFSGDTNIGKFIFPVDLKPQYNEWTHIGIQFYGDAFPKVFVDGMEAGQFSPQNGITNEQLQSFFSINSGDRIVLGGDVNNEWSALKAWYDDFKVIARDPTVEETCNYARGTMVKYNGENGTLYYEKATYYPNSSHNNIRSLLGETNNSSRYLCFTKYGNFNMQSLTSKDFKADLKSLPRHSVSIRKELTHMNDEGNVMELEHGAPRPNFTNVKFCTSCHVPSGSLGVSAPELQLDALQYDHMFNVENDRRRQPSQPPALIRGVVPAGYFETYLNGGVGPATTLRLGKGHSEAIDQFILPTANN